MQLVQEVKKLWLILINQGLTKNAKTRPTGHPKSHFNTGCTTNSVHDMLARLCEQQAAVGAALHSRRDLLHLEHSPVEWRLIEDLVDVLQPFKDATTYLSSESYPTLSVLG